MQDVTVLVAFGAGLLSIFSPCVLPLIPVYFASLAGNATAAIAGRRRLTLLFHSVCFVLGFTILFTLLGTAAGLLGLAVGQHLVLIRRIAGSVMILMGLFLLLALKVPWLNFEARIGVLQGGGTGFLRSFITGAVFALGWTPCVGPILGGILALALGTGTALQGAYLLIVYSFGLGLPFIIIGLTFEVFQRYLTWLQRYSIFIHLGSGLLLIVIGILILMDKLALLSVSV